VDGGQVWMEGIREGECGGEWRRASVEEVKRGWKVWMESKRDGEQVWMKRVWKCGGEQV
jgi:hypothetical protein